MKSGVIRSVIVLATMSILGIAITQVYWFKRAFDLNEDQFNRNVNAALYNVAKSLFDIQGNSELKANSIERLSTNYYIVNINNEIDAGQLEELLREEFLKRNINADFEYGIYDCNSQRMVYCNMVVLDNDSPTMVEASALPVSGKQQYYFGVYFPKRELQILGQMDIWMFSSIVLLIVVIFFAYASFVIFRQKRLSEIQKDFINNMTHEFKTPIATIALSAEVLKNPDIINTPPRITSYASIIQNESNRLKNQVDRVLQLAKLEGRNFSISKEWISLNTLIQEVISVYTNERQIHIDVNIADDFEVMVDKLHVSNVLHNLIDNAVKYNSQQDSMVNLTIEKKGNSFVINVKDNGKGIADNHQKRIFDKFFRVSTGNVHNIKGFGLGLYYVKLVIEAHNGSIQVESQIGKGTTFILIMPIQ